jgi:hypothetical protein
LPASFDDRTLFIYMDGYVPGPLYELEVKIFAGMQDCNGDELASNYKKDYTTF